MKTRLLPKATKRGVSKAWSCSRGPMEHSQGLIFMCRAATEVSFFAAPRTSHLAGLIVAFDDGDEEMRPERSLQLEEQVVKEPSEVVVTWVHRTLGEVGLCSAMTSLFDVGEL